MKFGGSTTHRPRAPARRRCRLGLAAVGLAGSVVPGLARADDRPDGARLFSVACAPCHGDRADGWSPATRFLRRGPRDLTAGVFRFKSTPPGSLPLDADIARTISAGVPTAAMPAFSPRLERREIDALVQFVKSRSPRFASEPRGEPIDLGAEPPGGASPDEGERLYRLYRCPECHGETGRGDGPSVRTLLDDRREPIRPPDLAQGAWKSGGRTIDLVRAISAGLEGTPMPSYELTIPPAERWAIARYIEQIGRRSRIWRWLADRPDFR